MKRIKAKFNVVEKTEYAGGGNGGTGKVVLVPVVGGSEENKEFWKYTPSGKIELYIDNPEAFKAFELGEYYVDFTKADKE